MGFDIKTRTEEVFGNEDLSWLKSRKGLDTCRSIMLDVSTFSVGHFTAKGAIPSGTILQRIGITDFYGPYAGAAAAAEVQTLSRTSTGGTYDLTWQGQTATGVVATAAGFTAAALLTALESLSNIEPGDVAVSGSAGGPLAVTFQGRYAHEDVGAITVDNTNATGGTVTVAQTTTGAGDVLILRSTTKVGDGTGNNLATDGDVGVAGLWEGIVNVSKLPTFSGTNNGEFDGDVVAALPTVRFERS